MEQAAHWSNLTGKDRPDKPWLDGMPRTIFVSDMSDALSKGIEFDFLYREIIGNVRTKAGKRHNWLWLTKRPMRMERFDNFLGGIGVDWPSNLWVGTSVTSTDSLNRIEMLECVGAKEDVTRFVSFEPLIGPVVATARLLGMFRDGDIHWAIIGGESGPGARPFHVEWAEELIAFCREHGVPVFVKQLGANPWRKGKPLRLRDSHGGDWSEWPDGRLRVRQMPRVSVAASGF